MAGCDPTGNGSALAGFGDQRNLELLVQGGFTPLEAIRIATLNGAKFLGLEGSIGSIGVGKQADLVVINGNPAAQISDIKKIKLVFKDGRRVRPGQAPRIDPWAGWIALIPPSPGALRFRGVCSDTTWVRRFFRQ